MHWQDFVFITGQVAFTLSLLPSVFSKDKPAFLTSIVSASFLVIFAFTYTTLSLWLAALGTATTSTLWFILAYQKYQMRRNK